MSDTETPQDKKGRKTTAPGDKADALILAVACCLLFSLGALVSVFFGTLLNAGAMSIGIAAVIGGLLFLGGALFYLLIPDFIQTRGSNDQPEDP